ncbi:hypothetical protein C6500_18810 [Candidatus Poribacteria bacterium]|nr:MAG: hypothetical protein C6500_18810 [Candidatus Poribacteria bacterium]
MFFPNDPTQNNAKWYVSEEPRSRLGKGIIGQIRYSPDGTQLAVGSSIGIWIYNAHTGKELNLLTGHIKGPELIAYSPDGHTLASGGAVWPELIAYSPDGSLYAGTVCLWNPNTGEHKVTLGEHEERVTCVEFSPDGSILASGNVDPRGDGTIRLWDVVTGKHKATLKGHTGGHKLMVFSPDGQTLASATDALWAGSRDDGTIRLWDTKIDKHKATLTNDISSIINSIAFSPDGGTIASAGWENGHGTVQLWDAATGEHKETLMEHTNSVFTVAYSPDGVSFLSGSKDGTILLWDTATYQLKAELTGYSDAIAFSPDSSTLAIAGRDRKIRLWDAVSGEHQLTLTEHTDEVYSLVFNPDGRTFAGIGGDSTIRLWDAVTGEHLQTITGHTRSVSTISFDADGSTIATGSGHDDGTSGDKIIRIWNVHSECLQSTFKGPLGRWIDYDRKFIDSVSYSPDGKTLASASEDGTIRLWDVESEKPRATTFEGLRGIQTSEPLQEYSIDGFVLTYSPDGKTLATSSRDDLAKDTTVQLWDAVTCKHKATLTTEHCEVILSIAFSPDSYTVAGGGRSGEVYLWDATNGELKTTLTEHTKDFVFSVAFSPDGRTLASGARFAGRGEVYLWDVVNGECKASLDRNSDGVNSIAFSPNGSVLAIGVNDGVTLWDVHKILHQSCDHTDISATYWSKATGRYKTFLKGHTGFVNAVAFSPDGRILASGSQDGTILLWDILKTPQTPRQIAQYALGSTVLVIKSEDVSDYGEPSKFMRYAEGEFGYATGNGFCVEQGLVAIYTQFWADSKYVPRRLIPRWINLIIQDIIDKNNVIKETNMELIKLFHENGRNGNPKAESIAALDNQLGLAILKVSDFDVQPLCLSSNDVQIGDTVYVASSPATFSQGIISSMLPLHEGRFFQVTAPIPDGCNGCPILNSNGQVIGIAAKRIFRERHFHHQNPNFVIPSVYLRDLLSKVDTSG